MSRPALPLYCVLGMLAYPFSGCLSLPSLSFPDAGEAGSPSDADATDMFPDAGCPNHPPPGATQCCQSVPCNGDCDAHCLDCQSKCSMTQVCCAKATAVCHQLGFVCP
jgi:hypothetical protein